MPNIIVTVDDEFINSLAKALNGRLGNEAAQTIADAGLTEQPDMPPDPWSNSNPTVNTVNAAPQISAPVQPRTITVNTPKGAQQWTIGANNAPPCNCGIGAAYVQGATNGRPWKRWSCAKGADNDWRNKCDFNLWA